MVRAVKNANMLGLNIKPKLITNIINPKMVFINPLVVLYSTSLTPFANKKIASNKTDNPRISAAAITPNIGNAIVIIPKIIAIMLNVVCLCKSFPPYFIEFIQYNYNLISIYLSNIFIIFIIYKYIFSVLFSAYSPIGCI